MSFFDLDEDLIKAAAQASPPLAHEAASREQIDKWVNGIPLGEKDDLLTRLIAGEESSLANELFLRATRIDKDTRTKNIGRKVSELLEMAEEIKEIRERENAERAAKEKARKEREAAVARAKYLNSLVGKEAAVWKMVDGLAAEKKAARYDEAITLLKDLRDLAEIHGRENFIARIASFREEHAKKPALIERMNREGL